MYVCIGNQQHNFFSNVANYMIQHLLHRTIFGLRQAFVWGDSLSSRTIYRPHVLKRSQSKQCYQVWLFSIYVMAFFGYFIQNLTELFWKSEVYCCLVSQLGSSCMGDWKERLVNRPRREWVPSDKSLNVTKCKKMRFLKFLCSKKFRIWAKSEITPT